MPFLPYRDNDLGLWPSSYPYILGRALKHYKVKPAVSICIINILIPIILKISIYEMKDLDETQLLVPHLLP